MTGVLFYSHFFFFHQCSFLAFLLFLCGRSTGSFSLLLGSGSAWLVEAGVGLGSVLYITACSGPSFCSSTVSGSGRSVTNDDELSNQTLLSW